MRRVRTPRFEKTTIASTHSAGWYETVRNTGAEITATTQSSRALPINSLKTTFQRTRKRLASKLQNPRLLQISFQTFRARYHRTKDPYYVKQFLGHKSLKNTEIYITIERTLFEPGSDEFTVKVAEKPEEMKSLLEIGFEYVCRKENLTFLRKRK